jgi:hypothetical protein
MRSPERVLLRSAVTIQMVRIKIPSGASGAAETIASRGPLPTAYWAKKTFHSALVSAPHAARCVACHGVRSHPVPVALVGQVITDLELHREDPQRPRGLLRSLLAR